MPTIFDYSDFRQFLKDCYLEKKSADPAFTYRCVATRVGFKSAGHFTQIIQGKANLTQSHLSRFSDLFGLKGREEQYFEQLVSLNQAKTDGERQRCFDRMRQIHPSEPRELNPHEYEFYLHWYIAAVRDILSFCRFKGDYTVLARMLDPPVTPAQAKHAVALLEKLGMARKTSAGLWEVTDAKLSANSSTTQAALSRYAVSMLDKARESLDRLPKEERSISWVGFSASLETFNKIQEEIRALRRKIIQMAASDPHPDRAWHLNMQVFPVSKSKAPKGGRI